MEALTVLTVNGGDKFWDQRRQRLRQVPVRHVALVCQACDWYVMIPERFGLDHVERLRKEHLSRAHWQELITGQVSFSEDLPFPSERLTEALAKSTERIGAHG